MALEFDKAAFARRLAAIRAEKGMTQKELADRSGVSLNAIAKYESERSIPSSETAMKLASTLGCSVDVLLARVPLTPAFERDDFNGAEIDMGWQGSGNTEETYEDVPVPPRG